MRTNLMAGVDGVREIEEDFKWERKGPRQGNKIRNLFLVVDGSCLGF